MSQATLASHYPTVSRTAVALGVSTRKLYDWLAGGAPGKTEQGYDVAAIAEWRDKQDQPLLRSDPQDRLKAAQAELGELKVAKARQEFIRTEVAKTIMCQIIAEAKTHLLQLPERLATMVKLRAKDKKGFIEKCERMIRETCDLLADAPRALDEAAKEKK